MRWFLIFPLLGLLAQISVAEVYRWVDADGGVHFTDERVDGAEPVKIPPMQTIPAPRLSPASRGGAQPSAGPVPVYTSLAIVRPAADEAIRANDGVVTINLALAPGLRGGDHLKVSVDGTARMIEGLSMHLSNLPRGGHTVVAAVVDGRGRELIRSESVTFFVLRARLPSAPAASP